LGLEEFFNKNVKVKIRKTHKNPDWLLKRQRRHARVENGIKEVGSGFGFSLLPCSDYNANRIWFSLALLPIRY